MTDTGLNLNKKLQDLMEQIRKSAGNEQRELFLQYCSESIKLKEQGILSEEEAAYQIVGMLQFDAIATAPEYEQLFDIAGDTEIPRTMSYGQSTGEWNKETADAKKQKEWSELVATVEYAKHQ